LVDYDLPAKLADMSTIKGDLRGDPTIVIGQELELAIHVSLGFSGQAGPPQTS
jgi:hypothetical protein